jgi:hypothetical protein
MGMVAGVVQIASLEFWIILEFWNPGMLKFIA